MKGAMKKVLAPVLSALFGRLLRLHRERPSDRHSAQTRDELSSLHPAHELGLRAIGKAYHFDRATE
jgi:hypothetical protein